MSGNMKTTRFLIGLLTVSFALSVCPIANAQSDAPTVRLDDGSTIKLNTEPKPFKSPLRTGDDDGDWFMEETTPKRPKPVKGVKFPDSQVNSLGVPITPDGRIIPLKNDGMPIMQQGSNLQITNEYVMQPGFYPGMPQWNTPYMGGLNPYFSPGMMPGVLPLNYGNGSLNFNMNLSGFALGTGGIGGLFAPYTYGTNTFSGTQFNIGPDGQPVVSPWMGPNYSILNNGFIPSYNQVIPSYGGYGMGGMGVPGTNSIGVPGMNGGIRPGIR